VESQQTNTTSFDGDVALGYIFETCNSLMCQGRFGVVMAAAEVVVSCLLMRIDGLDAVTVLG
jgi:hypothetical protein